MDATPALGRYRLTAAIKRKGIQADEVLEYLMMLEELAEG